MADPQSTPSDNDDVAEATAAGSTDTGDDATGDGTGAETPETQDITTDQLREEVEQKYDFDEFGAEEMAEMSADEWEAAFDPDTWITGEELLDRVEADLKYRVLIRDVFAQVKRLEDGRVVAYSDQGYALVHPDGGVEGFGTVLRDVKPVVALASMEDYDVPEMPEGDVLPEPADVPEGGGELGNIVVQIIAGVQILAGVGLLLSWVGFVAGLLTPPTSRAGQDLNLTLLVVAGLGFLVIGGFLLMVVANARLSDRFRAEEFRERLRAVGVDSGEFPEFVPVEDGRWTGTEDQLEAGGDDGGGERTGSSGGPAA